MAQTVVTVVAPSSGSILLWQTSTGVSPDPAPASVPTVGVTSVYRAQSVTDPLEIVIENADATNPVYLGGVGVTGANNGTKLAAGAQVTRSVVGNDSEYVSGAGNATNVIVKVGGQ